MVKSPFEKGGLKGISRGYIKSPLIPVVSGKVFCIVQEIVAITK
jgi:hypothetical protein